MLLPRAKGRHCCAAGTVIWLDVDHMGWLQGTDRERFNEIQQELSQLSTKFSNNLLDATKAFKKLLKDPAEVCFSCSAAHVCSLCLQFLRA